MASFKVSKFLIHCYNSHIRFSLYRDREALVEKDVLRTDRVLEFYKGQDNPHVADLYEMLMTYCQYNFDLGMSFCWLFVCSV